MYPTYILNFFFHVYSFLRDRYRAGVGEGQREETQNSKQPPYRLQTVSAEPDVGLKLRRLRSWPEPKSDAQLTEPPKRPDPICILCGFFWIHLKIDYRAQDWKQGDKTECCGNSVGERWWWSTHGYNDRGEKSSNSGYSLKGKKIGFDDGINAEHMWETSRFSDPGNWQEMHCYLLRWGRQDRTGFWRKIKSLVLDT